MGIPGVIRPCAFCLVRDETSVLIGRLVDPGHDAPFYRPLGGGILFGESGEGAIRREFREELGVGLKSITFLGFLENLFTIGTESYHELCLIFGAEPDGWSLKRFDGFAIAESIGETAVVIDAEDIAELTPFYPDGVRALAGRFLRHPDQLPAS
jgi:8-oxo-dGTP pyrophosphatase MutT (NUDIX family)